MSKTSNPNGRPNRQFRTAHKWIIEMLSGRDMPAAELKRSVDARRNVLGFSWRTLMSVKASFQILHYKIHNGKATGATYWTLKSPAEVDAMQRALNYKPMSEEELDAIVAQTLQARGIDPLPVIKPKIEEPEEVIPDDDEEWLKPFAGRGSI